MESNMEHDFLVEHWACMLNEMYGSDTHQAKLPKDENETFTFGEVFGDSLVQDDTAADDIESKTVNIIKSVFPGYEKYFSTQLSKEIEVIGKRNAIDDWDIWKISPYKLWGFDALQSEMVEEIIDADKLYSIDDEVSMKDVVDRAVEYFYEKLYDRIAFNVEDLEDRGTPIHVVNSMLS